MNEIPDPIDVRRYDEVVEVLTNSPRVSFAEAARRCGVSVGMVRKIWDGRVARPPVVVLDRLESPRRCSDCGALCVEWPCVLCEIERRNGTLRGKQAKRPIRFKYRTQSK
jgi:hypothetical protein